MKKPFIPLLDLQRHYQRYKKELDTAIQRVLQHQQWILGPEVEALEKEVAQYHGVPHAVGVASGTDALTIALRALAMVRKKQPFWAKEDEIITTPFTFVASASTILHAGAKPVFADIHGKTFNLDPEKVEKAITSKTVGMVVVHLFGNPCDMEGLQALAKKHGLFIVEDCAQSFGASYHGKKVGTFGDVGCFSFFPSKNLGGWGDGGMVITQDEALAKQLHILHRHGGKEKYNVFFLGYNSRLDTLQAAILRVKLPYLDEMNQRRRVLADFYRKHINREDLQHPVEETGGYHVYHQYTLRVPEEKRERWMEALKAKGIACAIYYPIPLPKMALFQPYAKGQSFPESERATREVLSLPVEPFLEEDEKERIVKAVEALE